MRVQLLILEVEIEISHEQNTLHANAHFIISILF